MVPPAILLLLCLFQPIYTDNGDVKISDLSFTPVTFEWQSVASALVNAEVRTSVEESWGTKGSKLGKPAVLERVKADGNCFFRAISYCITGSEEDHMKVRQAVVRFMAWYMENEVDEIHVTEMAVDGKWATDYEIRATARLLQTPIFVYAHYEKGSLPEWVQYTPREDFHLVFDDDIPRIYLSSKIIDHFDVVKKVDLADAYSPSKRTDHLPSTSEQMDQWDAFSYIQDLAQELYTTTSSRETDSHSSRMSAEDTYRTCTAEKGGRSGIKWTYTPVDYEWQSSAASALGVTIAYTMEDFWDSKGSILTKPKKTAKMVDDGNTFFRAISYCVTGEERDHMKVRQAVINYMSYDRRFLSYRGRAFLQRMARSGEEPEDPVITATAQLLRTPIFMYLPKHQTRTWEWIQYTSKRDRTLDMRNTIPRIYLRCKQKRYEVITDVEPPGQ